ncbi:uncharacterized protein L969DRAFT_88730 [Mixia osmundae IAM 14324]|uniref:Coronin n=1 Tax=Mixia osmundae (strain CBS 9802 / IAM 14324 / JCM 22182 / KY 12970) TaxID=764103 RepID=G7DZ78_MIXOS|nr:uncharacterized protein L969DRAFT_88730 [Mixia osmundae IAM 14324]KEI38290.1 hypothetical protein L969DRAFT_88730 [Mixia osmundae IAM 14324]GAA95888.1 hypothetical protein E5Q_02546 [Mixia osmundae IAM 14324]
MSKFVRASRYRHVYGQAVKKEAAYDNLKVSASAWDTDLVSINPKYLAVNYQVSGGGAFLVCPLSKTGKIPDIYPLCRAHTAPVLDTSFNPFNDDIIASGAEDSKVKITKIDQDKLEAAWIDGVEVVDLLPLSTNFSHGRKVGNVLWHPTAENVLTSASYDIKLWDVTHESAQAELAAHPDMVQSMSYNCTGSLLATTCKDKKLRIFDVRSGPAPIKIADSHTGVKASRVCWLGNLDRIVTTGFSKLSDRQVFLWDSDTLTKPIKQLTIDTSSGTLMPYWSDNSILFLGGKGDGNIRYYEYENDDLVYLTEYKSSDPQRGITFMPRRALNVSDCEIARAYKVTSNMVEPVSFIVPRKSDAYQADIYPPAPAGKSNLSAPDFFSGETKPPIYIELEHKAETAAPPSSAPTTPVTARTIKKQVSVEPVPKFEPAPSKLAVVIPEPSEPELPPVSAKAVEETPALAPEETIPPVEQEAVPILAPVHTNGGGDHEEMAELKSQLAERDNTIRHLELKIEQLMASRQRAIDHLSAL